MEKVVFKQGARSDLNYEMIFTIKNNHRGQDGDESAMKFIMLNIQNVSNSYQPDEKLSFCHSTFQTVRMSNTLNLVWDVQNMKGRYLIF